MLVLSRSINGLIFEGRFILFMQISSKINIFFCNSLAKIEKVTSVDHFK